MIFIMKCSDALSNDPTLLSKVEHLKKKWKASPHKQEKVKGVWVNLTPGSKCSLSAAVFKF